MTKPNIPSAPSPEAYASKIDPESRLRSIDQKRLDSFGFPKGIVKAFLRTADATNCVVMSRAPGGGHLERVRERDNVQA